MSHERSMTECLQEQVDHIRDALVGRIVDHHSMCDHTECSVYGCKGSPTFADWYDAGMPFDVFDFGDDIQREAVSYARGYLEGAADLQGVTVLTLLDDHDVLTYQPKPAPRKRRKKAG